ncbi:cytochrome P450 [Kovacikia minuta CCNUW1]|uniref:cytochrome P450 n=1 Tax=Kovacikia minuta TaxID=2931930 RepID=UPI001CCCF3A7|nr:cytochrome P450 [Kovacikia minuta]UBF23939.1 cytochrome P450 [Kovacikia minuta CCNUW1]
MTLPDGPSTPPAVQMMQTIVRPLETLETNFQRYGDLYTARITGFGPVEVLSSPDGIEALMTAPTHLFDSGRGNWILTPFVGETSLILLDGKAHQRQRKLLMPPFHGDRLRAYGQDICQITQQVIDRWQPGQTFSAREVTQAISLQVIMRTVFGVDEGEQAERLHHHLNLLLKLFDQPLNSSFVFIRALQKDWGALSPWGNFVRQRSQIDEILYAQIRERRDHPERRGDDILSLMLAARDEAGEPMTDQELRDEMMTLLFAGHETTATALAWALYWLHWLPEVGAKVLQELAELGPNPDPVAISRLPYLNAVCQETLRIYPVGLFAFSRILNQSWSLMDYTFEPGTTIAVCIYLLHHRPDLYPNPKQFRPERFLERQFSPYEYFPFGGGNRRCIGAAFALFEMKLVLATILSRWQLQLCSKQPIKPVRRGVTMAPARGVPMQVVNQRAPISSEGKAEDRAMVMDGR